MSTSDRERLKQLERENRELKRANERRPKSVVHHSDHGCQLGFKEVHVLLDRHVFPKLNAADEELCKLFAWDIVEYIDPCCWGMDPVTTPLSRREAMVFDRP